MKKTLALQMLGGTVAKSAEAIGINSQAISQWPENLPPRLADRVIAACTRQGIAIPNCVLHPKEDAATAQEVSHG